MLRRSPRLATATASKQASRKATKISESRAQQASQPSASLSASLLAKESKLWKQGFRFVVGVDEAGRGPLAGPVVVAACAIEPGVELDVCIDDSKKLSEEERDAAFSKLKTTAGVHFAVSTISSVQIDEMNILQATFLGMDTAVSELSNRQKCDAVLVDGPFLPPKLKMSKTITIKEPIKGGDAKVRAIAAASIIAKCTRDAIMRTEALRFPAYGFEVHKGYPVPSHRQALAEHGPCPIHRRSYAPVRAALENFAKRAKVAA